MAHVQSHCGTISKKGKKLGKIPITIHDGTRLNLALAVKRQKGQTDAEWEKDKQDLLAFKYAIYKRFKGKGDEVRAHKPSFVHPEPD